MSASDLIATFGETVTVTRYTAGSYTNGVWSDGGSSTFTAVMSIQPLKGQELLKLPEAERTMNYMKGYSSVELKTSSQNGQTKADVVTYQGKDYEVQAVESWRSTASIVAPYWKVRLAEVNQING